MDQILNWVATVATIGGALLTASNLGARITGYGFGIFLIGSLAWIATALLTGQAALLWTNAVLTVLNLFGMWRWLGRQARIEEGASAGAEASQRAAGESLFPVSLLLRAPVDDGRGNVLGGCVDAMAGCESGKLRYVVASQGGVGGVGETLRRIPWSRARMDSERLIVDVHDLERLQEIVKDEWPAR